jgi:preprotein translocase subunit SecE
MQASSSIGRAAVSKTAGWGFDSLLACHRVPVNEELKVQGTGGPDKIKLVGAILLVIAGIAGYYLLDTQATWLRWLAVVAGVALAAAVLYPSGYGHSLREFVTAARVELRKVVWPTRNETGMTTLVVFGFVIVAGVFFWFVDLLLAWATRHLTGQGG